MGMVGGGAGSFIGPVHRMAAELDGAIELVAGAFSQDPERSRQAGVTYRISPDRAYTNYQEMMDRESKRKDPIDFVCIVTPNHLHLPIAVAALEHGFHVMSDKPATANLKEAQTLEASGPAHRAALWLDLHLHRLPVGARSPPAWLAAASWERSARLSCNTSKAG